MAKLTKADVARHLRISRQTLYEWIQKGRISVDQDGTIDSAEVARLPSSVTHPDVTTGRQGGQEVTSPQGDTTRELIDVLKAQLEEARTRERFLQEQVDRLTSIIDRRLLEAPRPAPSAPAPLAETARPLPLPASPRATSAQRQRVRELLEQRRATAAGAHRTTRRRILAYMQQHPGPQPTTAIAQALGLPRTVHMMLKRMADAGMLVRVARGVYAVGDEKSG